MVVRFPNGVAVKFNDAYYVATETTFHDLYTDSKRTKWIARVPLGCAIEAASPCEVTCPELSVKNALETVRGFCRRRDTPSWQEAELLAAIKGLLSGFNRQRRRWSDHAK